MFVRRITLAVAFSAALAGCGAHSAPGDGLGSIAPTTSVVNDPKLEAAANTVIPELERAFPDTYSGVEMKHADHTMIIYRVPNPALDEAVRTRIPNVTVIFRDAKLSYVRMRELADRIRRDLEYWRTQGITINGVGPMPDGSAVEVLTSQGSDHEQRALAGRYGEGSVSVRRETPGVPTLMAPTGAPYTPPS